MKTISIGRDGSQRRPLLIILLVSLAALIPSYSRAQDATAVQFKSTDGVALKGHLFGSGTTGVILAHMYPTDQRSWFPFAKKLAGEGYCAMTFDFRGYGESSGDKVISQIDRDLDGAYLFLKQKTQRIFLIGASMGGTAGLCVASRQPVAGVVCISGPVSFRGISAVDAVGKVKAPCLFIAAEHDPGQAADSAQYLHQQAQANKDLLIVPGSEHGTYLFQGPNKEKVEKKILKFLKSP
jgi:pimeloyl-ACP methyl ester carboxylesterase